MSAEEKKQIQISKETSRKLDLVKAGLWFAKGEKQSNDTVLDYLLNQELEKMKGSKPKID